MILYMSSELAARTAAQRAELAETQGADAALVALTIEAMGAPPEQMTQLTDEHQAIADAQQRSHITVTIARKVVERSKQNG